MIFTATADDGPQVLDITARAGVFSAEEIACLGTLWQEYVAGGPALSGYHFVVARDRERVLGYSCYGPRDLTSGVFDLYWIAVAPEARRSGVGRALLDGTESAVRHAGGRMIIAETSGTSPYDATRRFYLGTGYRIEATIADFYRPGDDLAIFIKRFPVE